MKLAPEKASEGRGAKRSDAAERAKPAPGDGARRGPLSRTSRARDE